MHKLVGDDYFDLHLWDEVDHVCRAAVDFFLAASATEALHLCHGHALHAYFGERVFDFIELERFDDRFDLLHGLFLYGFSMRTQGDATAKAVMGNVGKDCFYGVSHPLMRGPTPVLRLDVPCAAAAEVWVKRDDLSAPLYGGNKVRKLEHILSEASRLGKTRLVTIGAVGSHHVLATTLFGRAAGFDVDAVLVAQPRSEHVVIDIRATLNAGAQVRSSGSWAAVPWHVMRAMTREAYFIPPGGSNVAGALGYVGAVRELAVQVRAGELPEPDVIFVALGSGGTAAGIAVGLEIEQLKSRLVAVCVADPAWATAAGARLLVRQTAKAAGLTSPTFALSHRLRVDASFLGRGYGYATPESTVAIAEAARHGLTLEDTYTGKTFAAALAHARTEGGQCVLYWNTLSSASFEPLLQGAPTEAELPPSIKRLLV